MSVEDVRALVGEPMKPPPRERCAADCPIENDPKQISRARTFARLHSLRGHVSGLGHLGSLYLSARPCGRFTATVSALLPQSSRSNAGQPTSRNSGVRLAKTRRAIVDLVAKALTD